MHVSFMLKAAGLAVLSGLSELVSFVLKLHVSETACGQHFNFMLEQSAFTQIVSIYTDCQPC